MNKTNLRLIPALIAIAFSGSAAAAGFQLQNQTGSGNGTAFAGAAAAAEDAGTVMWNPAGMTYLPKGHNIAMGGTILHRSIEFTNNGSSTVSSAAFPLGTTDGGDAGGTALIPFGYWAYSVNDTLSVGLGVSPTFGNVTEYDFSFVGRNAGYYADIEQININPSVAYKVNEMLSIGGGLNFAHNTTHFKQGVPASTGLGFPANNFLDVKGDAWAVGYNLGAMFQVTPSTRIGVTYRSELEFDLEGNQTFGTQVPGVLVNQEITAQLITPASASLALSQKIGSKLEMLADFTWTEWSVINTIQIKNSATGANQSALSYNFQDTWRVGLGGIYQLNDAWKLKFGVAFDKSPVKSAADRTMTLPDSDRTWLSLGARYQYSKAISIDVGYTHIFFASADTARAVDFPAGNTRQVIRGDFKTTADSLGLQLNYNF
jgi:long-chain fatty acid transport protein